MLFSASKHNVGWGENTILPGSTVAAHQGDGCRPFVHQDTTARSISWSALVERVMSSSAMAYEMFDKTRRERNHSSVSSIPRGSRKCSDPGMSRTSFYIVAGFLTRQNRTEGLRGRAALELLHQIVNVALALVLDQVNVFNSLGHDPSGARIVGHTDQIVQVIA